MTTRTTASFAVMGIACLATMGAIAQDDQGGSYIYTTYHYCDSSRQDRIDEIVEKLDKPIYDAAVDDGTITAWGYLAHHTGGKWRRAQYSMAPTLEGLFAAQEVINGKIDAKNEKLGKEAASICSSHDDYIWRLIAGNEDAGQRGAIGFSVYYVCDGREDQADALVKTALAPIYNRLLSEGKLVSWGWAEHIVGGEYRRLATMTAKDLPTLMKARSEAVAAVDGDALGEVFGEICSSHRDYIWEIRHEKG
ncbi:MAG TPA: hypothetical protein VLT59_05795 [Steroidobacteraceae bacterium]|nr:hypothetical protein [Steroidobacteraceae bacterium]